jgi:hypothetical protein
MAASESSPAGRAPPPLLGWRLSALPARLKWALASLAMAVVLLAGFIASQIHPLGGAPEGSDLEKRIIEVSRDPTVDSWDDALRGDFLVERFYILDLNSGERYVADNLKGRISDVEVVRQEDRPEATLLLLDTRNMRRDRSFYAAFISSVSRPTNMEGIPDAFYLGVLAPSGDRDAFPVNYSGELPESRFPFEAGEDRDVYEFMLKQTYKDITSPRGISVSGYVYALSTSDVLPLFKDEYKLERAIFVSELLVVDATSKANRRTFFELLQRYPRSGQ